MADDLDIKLLTSIKHNLGNVRTAELCRALESDNLDHWSPEGIQGIREILNERGAGARSEPPPGKATSLKRAMSSSEMKAESTSNAIGFVAAMILIVACIYFSATLQGANRIVPVVLGICIVAGLALRNHLFRVWMSDLPSQTPTLELAAAKRMIGTAHDKDIFWFMDVFPSTQAGREIHVGRNENEKSLTFALDGANQGMKLMLTFHNDRLVLAIVLKADELGNYVDVVETIIDKTWRDEGEFGDVPAKRKS